MEENGIILSKIVNIKEKFQKALKNNSGYDILKIEKRKQPPTKWLTELGE